MKVLLDTHAFLWLMADDARLSSKAKSIFLDEKNQIFLSMASAWEMAIKSALKKLNLPLPIADYVSTRAETYNIILLNVSLDHLATLETLPLHHKDPFDRLIISQSISGKFTILGNDEEFDASGVRRLW